MADGFAVHLGGGVYLDASGNIVFGPPSKAQIYQPPGGFRLDTKKIQDAFKDLSDILPRDDSGKKKWTEWGVPNGIVDFLSDSLVSLAAVFPLADFFHQLLVTSWTFGFAFRRVRFGPFLRSLWSFTPPLLSKGQH